MSYSLKKVIKANDINTLKELLQSQNVNCKFHDHETPLHVAAKQGHMEVIQCLIQCGADVNVKDNDDWTPLHYAYENGHLQIVQVLIENGADVNAETSGKESLLFWVFDEIDWEILQDEDEIEIEMQLSNMRPLEKAIYLLRNGANIDVRDSNDSTLLQSAYHKNNVAMMKFLLRNHADANVIRLNDKKSLLHIASEKGNLEIVS